MVVTYATRWVGSWFGTMQSSEYDPATRLRGLADTPRSLVNTMGALASAYSTVGLPYVASLSQVLVLGWAASSCLSSARVIDDRAPLDFFCSQTQKCCCDVSNSVGERV
ncbi:hypothetical protein QAD02_016591 [Eretmocerus hayati]|uniref:Uncharacterized protein n=1 Tax=Eretmocerus hayati TaxID=131215 RepID=A0ACC2PBZ1_9HYME|nr:hypothetical protein QAD02_016591 [Eretmocerus hayati]